MALPYPELVAVDALAWLSIHFVTGYGVHRLPAKALDRDTWLTRERRVETGGRLYARTLRINRWKRLLPEAGAVFAGGFNKRRLPRRDTAFLETYVRETRRAEIGHWLTMVPAPLFFLWNPWWAAAVMPVYALAVNAPCIASQRYNRIRLTRLLARRGRAARPPAS